jgi:hypothetical protein
MMCSRICRGQVLREVLTFTVIDEHIYAHTSISPNLYLSGLMRTNLKSNAFTKCCLLKNSSN